MTRPSMKRLAIASVLLTGLLASCSEMPSAPSFTPLVADPVIIGAGDIANCSSPGAALTAALLDVTDGTVFTAGDNAYMHGSYEDYMRCYEPHWGRHKGRTLPTAGNHEYETAGGQGYFQYFGQRAGPPGMGYYSVTLGRWLVLVLNSSIDATAASAQVGWLRSTLQQFHGQCVAAIWHHPVLSSGPNGGSPEMFEVWRILYGAGADVVITGHEHLYERYAPLDGERQPTQRGMRQFVVGTGGTTLARIHNVRPGSQVQGTAWGVLKMTLRPESYEWEFLPAEPGAFRDQGQELCR